MRYAETVRAFGAGGAGMSAMRSLAEASAPAAAPAAAPPAARPPPARAAAGAPASSAAEEGPPELAVQHVQRLLAEERTLKNLPIPKELGAECLCGSLCIAASVSVLCSLSSTVPLCLRLCVS